MPKKVNKLKPKKIKAVRAPRAPRAPRVARASKPHTHIINVYTTSQTEPFNPVFRQGFSEVKPLETTSTQYVTSQPIPKQGSATVAKESVQKELTTTNLYNESPFQVPFGVPSGKPKIKIGLDSRDMPLDVINLETSGTETGVEKRVRGPYKTKGKGSTIEKHQIIGRNIQNEYVRGVEGYDELDRRDTPLKQPVMMETGGMEFYTQGGKI